MTRPDGANVWPELRYAELRPTLETLQLWTQIAGKVRLARTPWLNHAWHATLYVTARGLTTGLVPYDGRSFEMEFDLVAHELVTRVTDGEVRRIALSPGSVAAFYAEVVDKLGSLGLAIRINETPNEIVAPTPFPQDHAARVYEAAAAHDFWRALVQVERVFSLFRTTFLGKCSPVHFFWGSFDLAVTRFSGRAAPLHPGKVPSLPDAVAREAYSHEVSSAGFWAGGPGVEHAAFYSYAYPSPAGFPDAAVRPKEAAFDRRLGEFLLPYDAVRLAADPDAALLAFLESTYAAAADLGGWDRAALDSGYGRIRRPRDLGMPRSEGQAPGLRPEELNAENDG